MARLADVTSEIRVLLKLLAVAVVVVAAIFIFFQGGSIIKNIFFPNPPAPPEEKFGRLPQVSFPTQQNTNLDYKINTLTGTLPSFSDRMNVYKIKRETPSLVALDTVRNSLANVGFTKNETKLSDSTYQWTNDAGDTIQYDIITDNFKINSNFLTDPPPSRLSGPAATKDGAYSAATTFLQSVGEDTSDLDQNNSTVTYLKLVNGQLVGADSQNDAQFIRLDLFQKDLGKYKIYYPGLTTSPSFFIYRNEGDIPRIVNANYINSVPDTNAPSTYPIKTTQQAFEDLKRGNAFIFNQGKNNTIDITDVTQGYFLGDENQQYLLPIIIFTGKDFTGYVSALSDTSVQN